MTTNTKEKVKCPICGKLHTDPGWNCQKCLKGIEKAQKNKSGKSKYFEYIHGKWTNIR